MGYWLAPYTGDGSEEDSFRPSGSDALEHWSAIDLRADCTKADGYAVMWGDGVLPVDGSRVALGADADGVLPKTALAAVARKLGVELAPGVRSVRRLVRSLLLEHATPPDEPSRWNPLDASYIRPQSDARHYRIHLGEMYDEFPVLSGGAVATESFNKADSTTLGPDLTWTEVEQNSQVKSNQFCNVTTGSVCTARAETALSTSHMYTQVVLSTYTGTLAPARQVGPLARFAAAATTFYWARAALENGALRLLKVVAGTQTLLGSGATPGFALNDVLKIVINGSALESYKNGVLQESITDTAITANVRGGIRMLSTDTTSTALDNFETGDYVLLATPPFVAGVGTVETPLELDVALPAFVAGTGTVQAPAEATGPAVVAGTGTVQGPVIDDRTLPAFIAGVGAVQAATELAVPLPAFIAGTGTVQTPTINVGSSATATPAVIAGVGTVQAPAPTDIAPLGFILGIGLIQQYDGYLYMDSPNNGNRVAADTPDSVRTSLSGDGLEIECLVALDDWAGGALTQDFVRKVDTYGFGIFQGHLLLFVNSTGAAAQATATISPTNGGLVWVKVNFRWSDKRVQLFTAPAYLEAPTASDYTQVGTDVTHTTADSAWADNANVTRVGGASTAGKFYAARVRDGASNGPIVASPDWRFRTSTSSTITDDQGNVWTHKTGSVQTIGSHIAGADVALPAFIAGTGTVQAPSVSTSADAVPTPAFISGVGTVQTPVELAVALPAFIAGVGTVQAATELGVALPTFIAGTGTVQAPTELAAALPPFISAIGTVEAPVPADAELATEIVGIGTVQGVLVREAATPPFVAGVGTVETPLELVVALLAFVAGTGTVQHSDFDALEPPTEITGVGTVFAPTVALGAPVTTILGIGTVEIPDFEPPITTIEGVGTVQTFVHLAAVPAVVAGTGTVQAPIPEPSALAHIDGVGTVQSSTVALAVAPALVQGLGTVQAAVPRPAAPTTVVVGVGTVQVAVVALAARPIFVAGAGTVIASTQLEVELIGTIVGVGTVAFAGVLLEAAPGTIIGVGTVGGSAVDLGPALVRPDFILGVGTVQTAVAGLIWVGVTLALAITKREMSLKVSEPSMALGVQQVMDITTGVTEPSVSLGVTEPSDTFGVSEALRIRRSQ